MILTYIDIFLLKISPTENRMWLLMSRRNVMKTKNLAGHGIALLAETLARQLRTTQNSLCLYKLNCYTSYCLDLSNKIK